MKNPDKKPTEPAEPIKPTDTPDPPLVRVRVLIHRTSYRGVLFAADSYQLLPKPDADALAATGHVEITGL